MVAALKNNEDVIVDLVNKTMFHVDSPRPAPGQGMFEWFGISPSGEGFALDFPDQVVDSP